MLDSNIWNHRLSGLMSRVFTNGPGDLGLTPGCVIPETLKMVLDTSLLNTQQYKVCIGLAVRVFANGPGDLGSISGRVIPKTQKMVLDASLLNTQHYKVRIKGKVEQSREGVTPSPTLWKAVITGDTVTRLGIPIRGRGKSLEEGQLYLKWSNLGKGVAPSPTPRCSSY